jgi:DNA (cytosine-5)-methyltransferase 1
MKLLDLFCGAGGAARGYQLAGFHVTGVDIVNQPRYAGDQFICGDALEYVAAHGSSFDVIHASPPCQAHSDLQKQSKLHYMDLIAPTRQILLDLGVPYVIENVEGAPLLDPVMICGASVPGLRVIRHRLFESGMALVGIPCPPKHPLVFTYDKRKPHKGRLDQDTSFVQVTGGGNCTVANKRAAMGLEWMIGSELNEAIPPRYTEHIGLQLMEALK